MRKENVLSLEEEEIQEDITEGFRAITGNVSRVMNFYSSNHAGAEMENIVLYGTGADICGMEQYLSDELSIPVSGESLREDPAGKRQHGRLLSADVSDLCRSRSQSDEIPFRR